MDHYENAYSIIPKKKIKLVSLNPHIVCMLCAGYLVNATTILECLHSFCKSCLVRYLQSSKHCPTCDTKVHETDPFSYIKSDPTLQDIINKLIPDIAAREVQKEKDFLEIQKQKEEQKELRERAAIERANLKIEVCPPSHCEKFDLALELDTTKEMYLHDIDAVELRNRYIRCPSRVKILLLKELVSRFYLPYIKDYNIKFKCDNIELADHEHVKLIFLKHWKRKRQPIVLHYGFVKLKDDNKVIIDSCQSKLDGNCEALLKTKTNTLLEKGQNTTSNTIVSPFVVCIDGSITIDDKVAVNSFQSNQINEKNLTEKTKSLSEELSTTSNSSSKAICGDILKTTPVATDSCKSKIDNNKKKLNIKSSKPKQKVSRISIKSPSGAFGNDVPKTDNDKVVKDTCKLKIDVEEKSAIEKLFQQEQDKTSNSTESSSEAFSNDIPKTNNNEAVRDSCHLNKKALKRKQDTTRISIESPSEAFSNDISTNSCKRSMIDVEECKSDNKPINGIKKLPRISLSELKNCTLRIEKLRNALGYHKPKSNSSLSKSDTVANMAENRENQVKRSNNSKNDTIKLQDYTSTTLRYTSKCYSPFSSNRHSVISGNVNDDGNLVKHTSDDMNTQAQKGLIKNKNSSTCGLGTSPDRNDNHTLNYDNSNNNDDDSIEGHHKVHFNEILTKEVFLDNRQLQQWF